MGSNYGHSTTVNVWERMGDKVLSTILHGSWKSVCVNLMFSPNLTGDVS